MELKACEELMNAVMELDKTVERLSYEYGIETYELCWKVSDLYKNKAMGCDAYNIVMDLVFGGRSRGE